MVGSKQYISSNVVVLVHGLGASTIFMLPLARHLHRHRYETVNWGYPSLWAGIESHAARLQTFLDELESNPQVDRFSLVTHSMGGILARRVLTQHKFEKLRSVVMLGPPNHGSNVAGVLSLGLGWLCQPLKQLSSSSNSFVNQLAVPGGVKLGIIAGSHDRVVSVASTHLPTEADHCVVPRGHTAMLFDPRVARQVVSFLEQGHFDKQSTTASSSKAQGQTINATTTGG